MGGISKAEHIFWRVWESLLRIKGVATYFNIEEEEKKLKRWNRVEAGGI